MPFYPNNAGQRPGGRCQLLMSIFFLGHPYPVTQKPVLLITFRRQPLGHTIQVSSVIPPFFRRQGKPSVRPARSSRRLGRRMCSSHPEPCSWRSCIAPPEEVTQIRRFRHNATTRKRHPRPSPHGRPYLLRHCVSDPAPFCTSRQDRAGGALTCCRIPGRRCTARWLSAVTKSTRSWTWTTLPQLKFRESPFPCFHKLNYGAAGSAVNGNSAARVSSFSGISPTPC